MIEIGGFLDLIKIRLNIENKINQGRFNFDRA